MTEPLTYFEFPSGLRAVHLALSKARVGYCGVAIRAGSRDESAHEGLAHFVEHTIFKGTQRRRSYHIINRMEAVGGELNAFTTKEDTVVYSVFPKGNESRGLELIADLILNSQFPDAELDKERQVIMDEIDSYLDTPADAVFDDFEDMVFAGSPLGHNILGSKHSVSRITSADCRRWLENLYRPERMVVFYAGNMGPTRFASLIDRYFTFRPAHDIADIPAANPPTGTATEQRLRHVHGNHQAHVVIGKVLPALDDAGRMSMALLTNILGGPGMNSLLNVTLRERRGLVYSVEAQIAALSDCALSTIYFGCDEQDRTLCHSLVIRQLDELADKPMSERTLNAARRQYLGQMILAAENTENRIISIARATLMRGRALSPEQIAEHLQALTPTGLRSCAVGLLDTSSLSLVP